VPEVVEVQALEAEIRDDIGPPEQLVEIPPPDRHTALGRERRRRGLRISVGLDVLAECVSDESWHGDAADASTRLRWAEYQALTVNLHVLLSDEDQATVRIDVPAL